MPSSILIAEYSLSSATMWAIYACTVRVKLLYAPEGYWDSSAQATLENTMSQSIVIRYSPSAIGHPTTQRLRTMTWSGCIHNRKNRSPFLLSMLVFRSGNRSNIYEMIQVMYFLRSKCFGQRKDGVACGMISVSRAFPYLPLLHEDKVHCCIYGISS